MWEQVNNSQLSKFLMRTVTEFLVLKRDCPQLTRVAAFVLGKQPGDDVYVLGPDLQVFHLIAIIKVKKGLDFPILLFHT